ncbi:M48 family metallopeptidase, partial [bacterium]|nr:M48 family metallopeptidase [bacterium]
MNFFEHQDRARKKSRGLILLFLVALAGITAGIYAVSRFAVWYFECGTDTACTVPIWDPVDFAQVSAAVVIFVGLVSLAKHLSLRGGGAAVAEMLGGREIDATTKDRHEKRLVNVVEEMAIAAGVPMPRVFVLSGEGAINAFAAGYSPEDAAVAVTQGTLERLSRDELQGVVAHEFSHILHGDIRLNVRMISVLFGILAIGIVGRGVLRASFYAGDRPRRRSGKDGGALPFLIIVGLALVIVGYIGTLVGRVIQSAISRQREFLADASAVAYTRNPDGIAGALKKIGGFSEHALLKTAKAGQAAHLFFGQGVRVRLFKNALSTHPPLAERIRRIDPAFDGDFPESESVGPIDLDAIFDDPTARAAPASVAPDLAGAAAQMAGANYRPKWARERMAKASDIADSVGRVSAGNVAAAGSVRRAIPEALQQSAADPGGATHLIGALVLDGEDELRARQLRALAKAAGDDAARGATEAWAIVRDLDPRLRLPLVDLAAPALRRLADAAR